MKLLDNPDYEVTYEKHGGRRGNFPPFFAPKKVGTPAHLLKYEDLCALILCFRRYDFDAGVDPDVGEIEFHCVD